MHIVKNWLVDNGWLDHTIRVPLILGIWGGKGQGVPNMQAPSWHSACHLLSPGLLPCCACSGLEGHQQQ